MSTEFLKKPTLILLIAEDVGINVSAATGGKVAKGWSLLDFLK